jgi:hypothetical protein
MATLANVTISDSGYLTLASGNTAQRPTTPTISTTTNRPLGIAVNGLKLYIPTFWAVYASLPSYLLGLPTTTYINDTDNGTFTISHACRVYLMRSSTWGNTVDLTGYTLYESSKSYLSVDVGTINVYYRDYAAGTYAFDNNSAMYLFDFGTNVTAKAGMMRYNTDIQALEHFNGLYWANDIVRSGLILNLDAGNADSYAGVGNTLRDISGNGRHGLLINTPTYSATYGGILTFNGSTNYVTCANDFNFTTGTYTIVCAARYSGATRGRIVNSALNNWLIGHWGNSTENYYAEGWVTSAASGTGTSDTNWRIQAATGNSTTDTWANYVNGVVGSSNNGGSAGPNGLAIGVYGANGQYNSEWSTGDFSFVLAYNRVLTATEIKQNFFAYRNRFGI